MSTSPSLKGTGEKTVSEILLAQGAVSKEVLRRAKRQAKKRKTTVTDILQEEGLVTDALMEEAIAEHYHIPTESKPALFSAHHHPAEHFLPLLTLFVGKKGTNAMRMKLRNRQEHFVRKRLLQKAIKEERKHLRASTKKKHNQKHISHRKIKQIRKAKAQKKREHRHIHKHRKKGGMHILLSLEHKLDERRKRIDETLRKEKREQAKRKAALVRRSEIIAKKQSDREARKKAKERKRQKRIEERNQKREEAQAKREAALVRRREIIAKKQSDREARKKAKNEARAKSEAEKQAKREARAQAGRDAQAKKLEVRKQKEEEAQRKKEAVKQQKEEARLRAEAKVQAKKDARSRTKEEAKQKKADEQRRKQEKKEQEAQRKKDLSKEHLAEEAKKEAMRQVIIEKEKSRLRSEGGDATQEVVTQKPKEVDTLQAERSELSELQKNLAEEKTALEEERKEIRSAKSQIAAEPKAAPVSASKMDDVRNKALLEARTEFEEKLHEQEVAFEAEKKALLEKVKEHASTETQASPQVDETALQAAEKKLAEERASLEAEKKVFAAEKEKTPEPANVMEKVVLEEKEKNLNKERASLESQKTLIRSEAEKEAKAAFEKERTEWEIEKGRIKQQAAAEAEASALSKIKGKGFLGFKQKSVLEKEITKWKQESEKLEKERLELERTRALQSEEERMQKQKQEIKEQKLQVEREQIEKERQKLEHEDAGKEKIEFEEEKLKEEKQKLEEVKKSKKKAVKKGKKKKKGENEEEEASAEEDSSIDIAQILLEQNYIEEAELKLAQKTAEERNVSVEHILKEEGLLTKDLAQNAVAEYYKMPFLDLSAQPPDTNVVELLPEEVAHTLNAIAITKKEDGTLIVATCRPETGEDIKKEIQTILPDVQNISLVYTSKDAIESALSFYRKALNTRFQTIIEQQKKIAPEIIEEIFADAVQLGASDIHFEPQEKIVIVRFRVDGVMHEAGRIPREYYEGIVNRIKIAGNMRIDEHFSAQDGAIRWKSGERSMDVRVSIVPIVDGEKIVMRLLSEYVRTLTLRDLGFASKQLDVLVKAAHKPFGMVLTTGPTGSGKSTTLYGLMKLRNSPDVNISTIEDPVEYKIGGINHIQVNTKANLTFERGLRALVRQDPDIILVGEIRDDITAQISVNAALTGHLLFSTLHANDAATAVPRLLEMGIEPYLLGSTLELIIAQRLMRRTCMNCRYSQIISHGEACKLFPNGEHFFRDKEEQITLYKGKGCGACGNTGFKGRVGVYELLVVSPEVEQMITERRTSGEINNLARSQGMLTLFEDGLEKVLSGLSTVEELLRISAPPDLLTSSQDESAILQKEE